MLNWTESPEIHSGAIHARFDRRAAERAIRDRIGDWRYDALREEGGWQGQAPLLRIPLDAAPDATTQAWLSEWATVIKLPLLPSVRSQVVRELREFDPVLLLFLRHIESVRLEVDGDVWHVMRHRRSDREVVLRDARGKERRYWLARRAVDVAPDEGAKGDRAEVAAAFALDRGSGESQRTWFNFFPVRNAPAPFSGVLLHATFLLKPDRDALDESEPEFHWRLADALGAFLAEEAIPAMAAAHGPACLRLLEPRDEGTAHVREINERLRRHVAESAFVPSLNGALASPSALWLYCDELAKLLDQGEGVAAVVEAGGETR
ncbi:MAG: hypothetical protein D6771_05080, partial [Zetaproteobacteria bacterium]